MNYKMKNNRIYNVLLALFMLLGIVACQDREVVTVDNKTSPILMNLSTQTIFLDKNFPDNPALNVTWDAASYTVPVEIFYKVEVSATSDFKTIYTLGTVGQSVRTATYTVAQMNTAAKTLGLATDVAGKLYIRVSSYLGTGFLNATSNVSSFSITPYALEYPTFYIVGAASSVGWNSTSAQVLYKKDNMSYIYTYLEKSQAFRFLGQQNWSPINYSLNNSQIREAYRYFNQTSTNLSLNGTDDENILFNDTTGIYKIAINATKDVQSINVTASPILGYDYSQIYLVGSMNGWDATNPTTMAKVSTGVYSVTTTLADDAQFKFIGQKSWADLEWGNILKDNNGNTGFLGPKGDNGNIIYKGGGSTYKITVNLKAGTYTIVKQ